MGLRVPLTLPLTLAGSQKDRQYAGLCFFSSPTTRRTRPPLRKHTWLGVGRRVRVRVRAMVRVMVRGRVRDAVRARVRA